MKLIIYVPAFNEEKNILQVLARLPRALEKIVSIQYLVVDDGSTDQTVTFAQNSGAFVISHGRNRGVGAAFHSAVQFALENKADILIGIDADGQFDPEEIPELIAPIIDNIADMVIGNRFFLGMPDFMPPAKFWGNKQISKLISGVSGQKFQDVSCGYRAYSRDALLHFNLFGSFTYTHETVLSLIFQGLRVKEHPIKVRYDPERKSRVAQSVFYYAFQTSKIIFRVILDYRPMRALGSFGGGLILIGMSFIIFLLVHYVLNQTFTPYKSFGFIGLGFFTFGMFVILIAILADMINRLRINQDRILYEFKKSKYGK